MRARHDGTVPIIQHGSVYLRPAERTDVELFVRWLSDARTTRTLGVRSPLSTPLEEGWFERAVAGQGHEHYHYVVCLFEDDRAVGVVDLHGIDLVNGKAELGILIGDAADTGKGYGGDAIRALLAFGFEQLRLERVELLVFAFNEGARRLYRRLGFVEEGISRHAIWIDGAFVDDVRMSMLADEWRALGRAGSSADEGPAATS